MYHKLLWCCVSTIGNSTFVIKSKYFVARRRQMFIIVDRKQISQVVFLGKLPGYVVRKMNVSELLLGLARHMTMSRVFVWGRRPDVSSGRFSFHVRFFDTNIWEFYFYCPFSFNILLLEENLSELQSSLRNAGNGVPECSILKISWGGGHSPRPS